ncbi:hypothetical protein A6A27_24450 [Micromonospora sp. CB01531]|nr:hypothetical protein A6A27_24450 [Micromonospora sp. CB01531]
MFLLVRSQETQATRSQMSGSLPLALTRNFPSPMAARPEWQWTQRNTSRGRRVRGRAQGSTM